MKILVTGCRGYIGYPLMLYLKQTKHDIVGVDNDSRCDWVENVTGENQCIYACTTGLLRDLTNRDIVNELLAVHKPDCIIHLASQPSMPYSQINGERATLTQLNNLKMTLNLLWGIKENGLKSRFIITTTTGIPGQHYKSIPETNTINMAGSWYHVSRGFDSANCRLASKQWDQMVVELRTSIVYGIQTELMRLHGELTRFDTDPYFGTVLNRFIHQAISKKPLTIYGKGEQTKPFISLEDTVQSLINAIDYDFPNGHNILNQVTDVISIKELATLIQKHTKCEVNHVPNPRKEKEHFSMGFENQKFLKLLGKKPKKIEKGIEELVYYFGCKNGEYSQSYGRYTLTDAKED